MESASSFPLIPKKSGWDKRYMDRLSRRSFRFKGGAKPLLCPTLDYYDW